MGSLVLRSCLGRRAVPVQRRLLRAWIAVGLEDVDGAAAGMALGLDGSGVEGWMSRPGTLGADR